LPELKYGKSKSIKAIDAQIPTPQVISSSLAALPNTPIPATSKLPNGIPPSSSASVEVSTSLTNPPAPVSPQMPPTPGKSVCYIHILLYVVLIHWDSLERKARNESKDIVHIRVIFGFYPFINAFIHDDGSLNILQPTTMTWLIGVIEPNLGVWGKQ
jgi:hypothetical protein